MKLSIKKIFVSGMLLAGTCLAAKHDRNWQDGNLRSSDTSNVYLGSYGQVNSYGNSAYASAYNVYGRQEVEVIEGSEKVYLVSRVLKYRWSKDANLTSGETVKFAVEGNAMYLLDEDGREIKTKIIKKRIK